MGGAAAEGAEDAMNTTTPLQSANELIALLVNALDAVQRAENLDYAKGAADYAIAQANKRRERNAHGYLEVR